MKNISHKVVDVDGKKIHIFDGVLDFSEREHIYSIVRNSFYKIGNEDGDAIESSHHKYLCSYYSAEDLAATGIVKATAGTEVAAMLDGLLIERVHVNLSTPIDTYWAHDHRGMLGMLYYANKHWNHEWAGETLFFNDDLSEVVYTSVYKPGRIIVFDGEIPHSVRPQSNSAPFYRFTLSTFFRKPQ